MALKCFLATGGRLQILPIYLPILNYAPEGESATETQQARWAQGKRHALGFAELVYFLDHFMRILGSISKGRDQLLFVWRSFFLWTNCLMTHLVMATYWFLAPLNAIAIAWFLRSGRHHSIIEVVAFGVNCITQVVIGLSFVGVCIASAILYDCVKDRVSGSGDPALPFRWRSTCINSVATILETGVILPLFFLLAAACEWVAAIKCAHTHRFDYEVALKPNLSKEAIESKSDSTASGASSASESEETSEMEDDSTAQDVLQA